MTTNTVINKTDVIESFTSAGVAATKGRTLLVYLLTRAIISRDEFTAGEDVYNVSDVVSEYTARGDNAPSVDMLADKMNKLVHHWLGFAVPKKVMYNAHDEKVTNVHYESQARSLVALKQAMRSALLVSALLASRANSVDDITLTERSNVLHVAKDVLPTAILDNQRGGELKKDKLAIDGKDSRSFAELEKLAKVEYGTAARTPHRNKQGTLSTSSNGTVTAININMSLEHAVQTVALAITGKSKSEARRVLGEETMHDLLVALSHVVSPKEYGNIVSEYADSKVAA